MKKGLIIGLMALAMVFFSSQVLADKPEQAGSPGKAKAPWVVAGEFLMSFQYLDQENIHRVYITDTAGVLAGNGGSPAFGPINFGWEITSGSISENLFSFEAVYTGGAEAEALGAIGETLHVSGTIKKDGSISGTWNDTIGEGRAGTWTLPKGTAQRAS